MPGHTHDNTHASANTGNTLGDRSSVRQSKLYRIHESGNGVKDILGSSHLAWKTNQKEGVYEGHTVYDHNNPYNEKSALAPLRDRRGGGGGGGGPSGGNIISSDYPSDNYDRFDSKSAAPLTVRTHNDIGLAKIPASELNSMSHSFQKKMNKGRAADAVGNGATGRRPSAENFKHLSPLSEKDKKKRSSVGQANSNAGAYANTNTATAAERMKQSNVKRHQAPSSSSSSSLLSSDLDNMSTEELLRLSDGMEELKRLALKAETQSRLDHLKEELAALEQGSPIHRAISGAGGSGSAYGSGYGRQYDDEEEEGMPPSSPRRQAPHHRLPPMVPDTGRDRDRGEGGYYPPSGQNALPSSSSRSLLLPPSPTKSILKKPAPSQLPKVRYQDEDAVGATAAAAARGLPPLRRGGSVGPNYASNAPSTSRYEDDWGGEKGRDRDRNRDRDRGGRSLHGGNGDGDAEYDDDAAREDREAYLSPRSRRHERQQHVQKSSPEAKAAIDELRHSAGKFFNTDYHGKLASTNQLAFNNNTVKPKFDPNFVFGKKTARDSYDGEGSSVNGAAHSSGGGGGNSYGKSDEAGSPSQRLHRSAPFAMDPDLPSFGDRLGDSAYRPSRDREKERDRERAMERQRQVPSEARTSASEGQRNTRPW